MYDGVPGMPCEAVFDRDWKDFIFAETRVTQFGDQRFFCYKHICRFLNVSVNNGRFQVVQIR